MFPFNQPLCTRCTPRALAPCTYDARPVFPLHVNLRTCHTRGCVTWWPIYDFAFAKFFFLNTRFRYRFARSFPGGNSGKGINIPLTVNEIIICSILRLNFQTSSFSREERAVIQRDNIGMVLYRIGFTSSRDISRIM